jgi:hypothetical protein
MANRRFLVMARVGDKSLHGKWIEGGKRNFDLYLSYYGSTPGKYAQDADYLREIKGLKWPVLHNHIVEEKGLIEKYDAVWFPDDDLLMDTQSINRMFDLFCAFNLSLAQPALSWDSYCYHFILLRNDDSILRYTNFVEVMAPVFSKDALSYLGKTFNQVRFGHGLDFLWPYLIEPKFGQNAIAVIDAVEMVHTRPGGGGDIYKADPANSPLGDLMMLRGLYPDAVIDYKLYRKKIRHCASIVPEKIRTGILTKIKAMIAKWNLNRRVRQTKKYSAW